MTPGVRLRDGIEVEFASGETVLLDGEGDGEATVVSHAHGDHLVDGATEIIASEITADLASVRQDTVDPEVVDHPAISLHNAGHIAGSRAAQLTDPETERTYLYTGDCCTRDRFYLEGFEPIDADVLIIESTYGKPKYTFPPTDEVVEAVHEWLSETMDEVVILFGYALGRAQKIQRILNESARDRVFVTDAIADLNDVIESHLSIRFTAERYDSEVELEPGDALLLPMQTSRLAWIESLIESHDATTAGFSGWATDQSFIYRRGVDQGFVLSDHCDFDELIDIVLGVDPEMIYTHHGFTEEFASYLTRQLGYETRALKENQSTLADY